jgi:hypothetical protein
VQHLEGSGTPVLYIGRTVLKGQCSETLGRETEGTERERERERERKVRISKTLNSKSCFLIKQGRCDSSSAEIVL